jgi:hypothetical protein
MILTLLASVLVAFYSKQSDNIELILGLCNGAGIPACITGPVL